jgi:hypothetical protein
MVIPLMTKRIPRSLQILKAVYTSIVSRDGDLDGELQDLGLEGALM